VKAAIADAKAAAKRGDDTLKNALEERGIEVGD